MNPLSKIVFPVVCLIAGASGIVHGQSERNFDRATQNHPSSHALYVAAIAAAEKSIRLDEIDEAARWLQTAPDVHRGWEWSYLNSQLDESSDELLSLESPPTDIQASPDGQHLAVSDGNGAIFVVDRQTRAIQRTIGDHTGAVYRLDFSHDGRRLASVSRDMTARVWDVESGEEISRIQLDNPGVAAISFSPDGNRVATCTWMMEGEPRSVHGIVWIWDANSGKVLHRQLHGVKPLDSIAWSDDGESIAVGSWDGMVHLLDSQGNQVRQWHVPDEGIYSAVMCVDISSDGLLVAAGGKDRTVRVWNRESGELLHTLRGHQGWVNDLSFGANHQLATACDDALVRIWDLDAEPIKMEKLRGHARSVSGLSWAGNHSELFTVSRDLTLKHWRAEGDYDSKLDIRTGVDGTYSTTFTPDGQHVYVATFGGDVLVFDSWSGEQTTAFNAHGESSCNMSDIDDGGNLLLTCSWDETGKLWSIPDHQLLHTFDAGQGVYNCRLSPDGRLAALCTGSVVQVWNTATGEKLGELASHEGGVREVAFTSDGQRIVTSGADRTVGVWNANTLEAIHKLKGHERAVHGLAISPDDRWAASGDTRGEVIVWDLESGEIVSRVQCGDRMIQRLDYSADGTRLAVGSSGLSLIEPVSGIHLVRLQPLPENIWHLSFSPDGNRLAACTTGGRITICNSMAGKNRSSDNSSE